MLGVIRVHKKGISVSRGSDIKSRLGVTSPRGQSIALSRRGGRGFNGTGGGVKTRVGLAHRGQESLAVGDVRAKLQSNNKSRIQDARQKLVANKRVDVRQKLTSKPVHIKPLTVRVQDTSVSSMKLSVGTRAGSVSAQQVGNFSVTRSTTGLRTTAAPTVSASAALKTKVQIQNEHYRPQVRIQNEYGSSNQGSKPFQPVSAPPRARAPVQAAEAPQRKPTATPAFGTNTVKLRTTAREDGRLKPPPEVLELRRPASRPVQRAAHPAVTRQQRPSQEADFYGSEEDSEHEEQVYIERRAEKSTKHRVRMDMPQPQPAAPSSGPLRFPGGKISKPVRASGAESEISSERSSGLTHILSNFDKSKDLSKRPVENTEVTTSDVVSPIQGFKIVVSNLCSSVTEDDVVELFGSQGPLKRARLLRAGRAEVVYVQRQHAQNACRKFNNRELDGKPMQIKLVTAAPKTQSLLSPEEQKKLQIAPRGAGKPPALEMSVVTNSLFRPAPSKGVVDFVVKL